VTDSPPSQVRPLAAVLQDLKHGAVLDQASTELQQLVAAVTDTRKKGKLVVEITVEPMKNDDVALTVTAGVKVTRPPAPANSAIFFADDDHNLVRDDPRQAALPGLRRVDLDRPEPKELAQ
jgi:hypothetical protein